jgi:hypothetical protein
MTKIEKDYTFFTTMAPKKHRSLNPWAKPFATHQLYIQIPPQSPSPPHSPLSPLNPNAVPYVNGQVSKNQSRHGFTDLIALSLPDDLY